MYSRLGNSAAIVSIACAAMLTLSTVSASAATRPGVVAHTSNLSAAGPSVVAIGDSVMAGHGLATDDAWLAVLADRDGWSFTNLASDGSGFATRGDNGDDFADQAAVAVQLRPDVIVISASSNDLDADDETVGSATLTTITELRRALPDTRIIAVTAVWGDTSVPNQLATFDADVDAAVTAVGGKFVYAGQPLAGRADLMQSDDVHPTAAGQVQLANRIGHALARAGITI